MITFRLPSVEEKSEYVRSQFERIAKRYDLTNDVISLGMHHFWKKQAIQALNLHRHGHYLDCCCGTGDLSLIIARQLSDKGKVTGVDFSANMLSQAQARSNKALQTGKIVCTVEWKQGDAQDLPFAENTFDAAVISFGLRNLSDLNEGLRQLKRVVRPGGKVVNLDLGHPSTPLFTPLFNLYFRKGVPLIGQLLQNDRQAYTYLPESRSTYPQPEKLAHAFEEAGLTCVSYRPLAFGSVALHVGTVSR